MSVVSLTSSVVVADARVSVEPVAVTLVSVTLEPLTTVASATRRVATVEAVPSSSPIDAEPPNTVSVLLACVPRNWNACWPVSLAVPVANTVIAVCTLPVFSRMRPLPQFTVTTVAPIFRFFSRYSS